MSYRLKSFVAFFKFLTCLLISRPIIILIRIIKKDALRYGSLWLARTLQHYLRVTEKIISRGSNEGRVFSQGLSQTTIFLLHFLRAHVVRSSSFQLALVLSTFHSGTRKLKKISPAAKSVAAKQAGGTLCFYGDYHHYVWQNCKGASEGTGKCW